MPPSVVGRPLASNAWSRDVHTSHPLPPHSLAEDDDETRAYLTLITRASYLAGVVLLADSLKREGSRYPLVVLYTSTLSADALDVLICEAPRSNLILRRCDLLVPRHGVQLNVAHERFTETWTKLRVFEAYDLPFRTVCYLDADMLVLRNMDTVFDHADFPPDGIAAVADCICNTGTRTEWTPPDHNPENCAFTPQVHPQALAHPLQPTPGGRPTHQLFNSGLFLCSPNQPLWADLLAFFTTTDLLGTFSFPDQQLLNHFFRGRWSPVAWQYNAVKTMAYRHRPVWRADRVVCVHYINDKPWAQRVRPDGSAGLRGLDGRTHAWWWRAYDAWAAARAADGHGDVVRAVSRHTCALEGGRSGGGGDGAAAASSGVAAAAAASGSVLHQPVADSTTASTLAEDDRADSAHNPDFLSVFPPPRAKSEERSDEVGERRRDSHLQ